MPQHRRLQTRHPVEVAATLEVDGEVIEGELKNLSLGGAFVAADLPKSPVTTGTRGRVRFRIPTQDDPVAVGCSIRWVSDDGFGLQFDGLRAREVWSLTKFFDQLSS